MRGGDYGKKFGDDMAAIRNVLERYRAAGMSPTEIDRSIAGADKALRAGFKSLL